MSAGRYRRLAVAVAAAATVLAGTGAGSCAPRRQPDPDAGPSRSASASPRPTQARGSYERHSELQVASGLRPVSIEFYDAYTGYALMLGCDNGCRSALFVTFDGGYSWLERRLPFDRVEQLQLDVVDGKTVVLTAVPDGWYRSTDTGRTFTKGGDGAPKPADVTRGASIGCPDGADCSQRVLVDGAPTPGQPSLPAGLRSAVLAKDGSVWAAAANDTTVYTARSTDRGLTWQSVGGPLTVPGAGSVQLAVSLDGTDLWLLTSAGTGSAAVHIMGPAGWRPVSSDLRVKSPHFTGVAVGDGTLAVTGERFGYLFADGLWSDAARPVSAAYARMLVDGTLMTVSSPSDVWLGAGTGAARSWSRVTIDPVWS